MLLVYHEPGVEGSESMLAPVAARLRGLGFDAILAPLGRALKECKADRVYLLMFARGGHWASLRDACGREPRVIPAWVSASAIAGAARGYGRRLMLLYRRARRLNGLYSRGVAGIAARLRAAGFHVYTVEANMAYRFDAPGVDVVVPLSLLPGRLVGLAQRAARLYGGVALPAFAVYGLDAIASWVAGELLEESLED